MSTEDLAVPVFGEPHIGATIRPSAYGIIAGSGGRIAVVRTPLGWFLPGGGSDETESPEATVTRETLEECGLAIRVGAWRRSAIEHSFSVTEQTYFEKHSTFCDAVLIQPAGAPSEPDHALVWMAVRDARTFLSPPGHRWAVDEWLASAVPADIDPAT